MAKYVVMFETDKPPDPGNCDTCEFNCPYYISYFDKQMIMDHDNIRYIRLNDFYCPIRVVVDVETFMKMERRTSGFRGT